MGACSGTLSLPYFACSLRAHVAVELVVERLDLVQSRSMSASKSAGGMS